jgi:RNA polymerase sigma factor (sigma-70 family)
MRETRSTRGLSCLRRFRRARLPHPGHHARVNEVPTGAAAHFVTTQWNLVVSAGRTSATERHDALEQLCRAYWYPVYAFVRRRGHDPDQAQDLTQEFFARLLEKNYLHSAHPAKGRFRTFLLTAVERFLTNEWIKARRQKRGGGRPLLPLNGEEAESLYQLEPADPATPERLFDRKWALALLRRAMDELRAEAKAAGREALFQEVRSVLSGDSAAAPYAEIAARLQMTEGAVKAAVHRWRRRYADLVRDAVAQTVAAPGEVEAEIRELFLALAG